MESFHFSYILFHCCIYICVLQVYCQDTRDFEEAEPSIPVAKKITEQTIEQNATEIKQFPQNIGHWTVNFYKSNSSCIIFQGALQLRLNSTKMYGNSSVLQIDVPINASSTGSCAINETLLKLNWESPTKDFNYVYDFQIRFGIQPTNIKQYSIWDFTLYLTKYNISTSHKESEGNVTLDAEGPYFPTDRNRSYACMSRNVISGNLTVLTSGLQFEAFRSINSSSKGFSEPEICKMDQSTAGAVVGIVVGSILALLLAIGLGMYVGIKYGYFHFPCCRGNTGYQRLDI